MKRTRNIHRARFRKRLMLATGVAVVPLFLLGCDQHTTTQPFSSISQCQQQYQYSAAQCRQIYAQAIDQAKVSGPQYRTQQDCVNDNRDDPKAQQQCQYTRHGSSSHFFYVPRYYSYSPGSYAQPFYRSRTSSGFTSAKGKPFTSSNGGYRSVSRSSTTTVTRGGFGRSVSSHSSFGHSSGG